jgi:hypothetical protein
MLPDQSLAHWMCASSHISFSHPPPSIILSSVELSITKIMATNAGQSAWDIERAEPLPEETIESFLLLTLPSYTKSRLDKSGTVCFVCLDCPRDGQYAVQVKCLKSKRGRKIRAWRIGFADDESPSDTPSRFETGKGTPIYGPLEPWDTVFEDDRAVYTRMLNVCFQYMGEWRRWLPFYGVVSVTEVMVSLKTNCFV